MLHDATTLARDLSISREAAELWLSSEAIDLHVDTFIWARLFGYDLAKRHGTGPFGARFWGSADIPRVVEAELAGAIWVITTNPLRGARGKRDALLRNFSRLVATLSAHERVRVVTTLREHRAARAEKKHAAWLGIQGGNALEHSLDDFDRPELAALSRVTLLHFTRSRLGAPALPRSLRRGDQNLTEFGRDYLRKLNERRILVDLAHLSREGFWDALSAHDRTQPLAVTHTACDAVFPHFRNVTDEQLRAVADTGGVVGVLFQSAFLGEPAWGGRAARIVDHLEHVVRTVGEDHAALGSDFDGAIIPPRDLKSVLELPRLVHLMLERGFSTRSIQKILGENALRVMGELRP